MTRQPSQISIFEHEALRIDRGEVRLSQHQLTALQTFHGELGTPYYSLIHNGVKFGEYVGVIQVGNTLIEVLPKADRNGDAKRWRAMLIGMLKAVGYFDIHAPSTSSLNLKSNSILDLYFELFINEIETLLHGGLIKKYRKTEGNIPSLKGALQFSKHIKYNIVHQERFYVRYSIYDVQHSIHQILYLALQLLSKINSNIELTSRIGSLLLNFPEMAAIKVSEQTFERISLNRKTSNYKKALDIARLLLLNYHPDLSGGRNNVLALMFDMNLLWEQFVYTSLRKGLKRQQPDFTITAQTFQYFWIPNFGYRTKIIPDIVINKGREDCVVLDTKWKSLNGYNPTPNDLRQMYVYHEYYNARKVALVYPGKKNSGKSGLFLEPLSNQISKKECSVIPLSVEKNVPNWQKSIFEEVMEWYDRGY